MEKLCICLYEDLSASPLCGLIIIMAMVVHCIEWDFQCVCGSKCHVYVHTMHILVWRMLKQRLAD